MPSVEVSRSLRVLSAAPITRKFWIRDGQVVTLQVRTLLEGNIYENLCELYGVPVGALLVLDPTRVDESRGSFFFVIEGGLFEAIRVVGYISGYFASSLQEVTLMKGSLLWAYATSSNLGIVSDDGRREWTDKVREVGFLLGNRRHEVLRQAAGYANRAADIGAECPGVAGSLVFSSDLSLKVWVSLSAEALRQFDVRRLMLIAHTDAIWCLLAEIVRLVDTIDAKWSKEKECFFVSPGEIAVVSARGVELASMVTLRPFKSAGFSEIEDVCAKMCTHKNDRDSHWIIKDRIDQVRALVQRLNAFRTLSEVLVSVGLLDRFGDLVPDQDIVGFIYSMMGAHASLKACVGPDLLDSIDNQLAIATGALMSKDFAICKGALQVVIIRLSY